MSGEGNTRATAVFTMKYLHTFGFTFDNSVFQEHSWYFRNVACWNGRTEKGTGNGSLKTDKKRLGH